MRSLPSLLALLLAAVATAVSGCSDSRRTSLDLLPATSTARLEVALRTLPEATLHLELDLAVAGSDAPRTEAMGVEVWFHRADSLRGREVGRGELHAGSNTLVLGLPRQKGALLLEVVPRGIEPDAVHWRRATLELSARRGLLGAALDGRDLRRRAASGAPNVVVYLVDTLRADALHVYGSRRPTPQLDRFARQGVRFADAVSAASWTRPATASLLTGLYPSHHRAQDRPDRLPESAFTLAERLRLAGYATAAVICNGNIDSAWGFSQGFDVYVRPPVPDRDPQGRPRRNLFAAEADEVALEQWRRRVRGPHHQPIFLYVHTVDPHGPYDPPEWLLRERRPRLGNTNAILDELNQRLRPSTPELVASLRTAYDGEVAYADREFGSFLRRLGSSEPTVVVVTADHGEAFQEHGFSSHGMSLFEEELHVPLLFWAPGLLPAGRVVEEPVSQVDILPTLIALTVGSPVRSSGLRLDGVDLSPLWQDPGRSGGETRALLSELDYDGRRWLSLRAGGWKLLEDRNAGREWLFDLRSDPGRRWRRGTRSECDLDCARSWHASCARPEGGASRTRSTVAPAPFPPVRSTISGRWATSTSAPGTLRGVRAARCGRRRS